jgi:hypothetical protein
MSQQKTVHRINLGQFADRFRTEMIPLGNRFCYFCAAVNLTDEDLREYLEEPTAALPPVITAALPRIRILLVPYLEKANGREKSPAQMELLISLERPLETKSMVSASILAGEEVVLAFAVKDAEVADYHYRFYRAIAELVTAQTHDDKFAPYVSLIREELTAGIHGEVDEASWRAKQALVRRGAKGGRETRAFREYSRQSFVDTLTLYLHGICCDIDVETGPRQLPSRFLRKRLRLIREMYAPPEGYAVFPEELSPAS